MAKWRDLAYILHSLSARVAATLAASPPAPLPPSPGAPVREKVREAKQAGDVMVVSAQLNTLSQLVGPQGSPAAAEPGLGSTQTFTMLPAAGLKGWLKGRGSPSFEPVALARYY